MSDSMMFGTRKHLWRPTRSLLYFQQYLILCTFLSSFPILFLFLYGLIFLFYFFLRASLLFTFQIFSEYLTFIDTCISLMVCVALFLHVWHTLFNHHFYLFSSHMDCFFLINFLCLAFGFPLHLFIFSLWYFFFKILGCFFFFSQCWNGYFLFLYQQLFVGGSWGTCSRITALFPMINDFVCMFISSAHGHSSGCNFLNSLFSPPCNRGWPFAESMVCVLLSVSILFLSCLGKELRSPVHQR